LPTLNTIPPKIVVSQNDLSHCEDGRPELLTAVKIGAGKNTRRNRKHGHVIRALGLGWTPRLNHLCAGTDTCICF